MAANGSANEESDRESGREFDPEMEGALRDHFASEASDLVHPGDPWQQLEGRMEEQPTRRLPGLWLFTGSGQRRWAPALAAAVVAVVAVVAVAVIWTFAGDGDEPGPMAIGTESTPAPAAMRATAAPRPATDESGRDEGGPAGGEEAAAAPRPETTNAPPAEHRATAAPAAEHRATTAPAAEPPATIAPQAGPRATAAAAPTAAPRSTAALPGLSAREATPAPAAAESAGAAPPSGTAAPGAPPQLDGPGATTFKDYGRLPFVSTAEDAVSTFSLDTDRTSFQLALNWARSGYEVAPDSVRAEEWVNSFDYGYRPPSDDWGFAITSDVVQHPLDGGKHLARIAFQAAEVPDHTPLNVTLVLDASGSMASGNRVAIARQAAETIRQSLRSQDRIAVVHFTDYVLNHLTVEHRGP